MKGLLLKDYYMMIKYCRIYLLIAVVFLGVSFFNSDNLFLVLYPCVLSGMIPVNLLAYDEKNRWLSFSAALPYTKSQIVSSKYLIGLFAQLAVLIVTGISQAVQMKINGVFSLADYAAVMMTVLIMSTVTSSVSLPFIFKLGVEKGRIAYYAAVGFVCAIGFAASRMFETSIQFSINLYSIMPLVFLAAVGIYAFSWYISAVFYNKREI